MYTPQNDTMKIIDEANRSLNEVAVRDEVKLLKSIMKLIDEQPELAKHYLDKYIDVKELV